MKSRSIAAFVLVLLLGAITLGLVASRPKHVVAANCAAVGITIQQRNGLSDSFVDIDIDTGTLLKMSVLELHRFSMIGDSPEQIPVGDMRTITYVVSIPHVLFYRLTNWCGSYTRGMRIIWP